MKLFRPSIHIAATLGDPSSIGPEVAADAILRFLSTNSDTLIHIFGPRECLLQHSKSAILSFENQGQILFHGERHLKNKIKMGAPSLQAARRAVEDLDAAAEFCLRSKGHALVTGPVDKYWCAKISPKFSGQTEFLQKKCGAPSVTMVLAADNFRVALVTTHLPISKVPKSITAKKIQETVFNFHEYLKSIVHSPKIAVCGLNPHASDQGLLGSEEARIIAPTIKKLARQGVGVSGPYPADTLFHQAKQFDGIVAMYHDQGLIPMKTKHFYEAINMSLGLPFLRCSVDHGTAFDIAGQGKASSMSYGHALQQAYDWAKQNSSVHSGARRSRA